MTTSEVTVVIAGAEDRLAADVVAVLRGQSVRVLVLDAARPMSEIELSLELGGPGVSGGAGASGRIGVVGGDGARIEALSGVLWRTRDPFAIDDDLDPRDRSFVRSETNAAWDGLLGAVRCPVLNRPTAPPEPFWCTHAPAHVLRGAGFDVPDGEISRDLSMLEVLPDLRWLVGAACAPSRARLIPGRARGEVLADLAGELAYVVEIPRGRLLELFVAGNGAVATEDDGHGGWCSVPAPPTASTASAVILRRLGLDFGAVLAVETSRGAFTCVNVDPSPDLAGLDAAARHAVASIVAAALCPEVAA